MTEDFFNPESGELILGDIILSVDKIIEQAASYGHSQQRELGFLVAHSMLHLFGYDHMQDEERGSDGGEAERHFEYAESEALVHDQLQNSEIGFGDR